MPASVSDVSDRVVRQGRLCIVHPRQVCPNETLVCGEPFQGERRGGEQGVVREALMRADKGPQGLRDGAGEEEVRPRKLFVQVGL